MWTETGHLLMWITWIDDCVVIGMPEAISKAKSSMKESFECDDVGELKDHVGVKLDIDRKNCTMKMTQPVLIRSFQDEFDLPGEQPPNPAKAGEMLEKGNPEEKVSARMHKCFRKGVGKLLHMMRWSRPEILNSVRECSRYVSSPVDAHIDRMHRIMDFVVSTKDKGWFLNPNVKWDGKDKNFEFVVSGLSDSDYNKDIETRHSVSGSSTFLCGAPVSARSRMQGCVSLSVTESEFIAGTDCVQDMLFVVRLLESMGLKVQKPMVLEMDNKGAVDLANNWSCAGRTRHVASRICFLRELKEESTLIVKWRSNSNMHSDIFTKNVGGEDFNHHASVYVRE